MTVIERFKASGITEIAAFEVAAAIGAAMPLGRSIILTDEILRAAELGDRFLLQLLLSEEAEPDELELAALRELDEHPDLRETISLETIKADSSD